MAAIYEIDYSVKDTEKWKATPKPLPQYVVAESVAEAVKKAEEFEDDNLTLLKCNMLHSANVAVAKKFKGLEPQKAST